MKRSFAVIAAILVLVAMFCAAASAEVVTTDPGYIYFEAPSQGGIAWNNYKAVYCHIWSRSGGDIYGWQDKKELCEDMGGGLWRYDLSVIEFEPEGEYSLIFSNDNGSQTYNLNVTSSCLGDIAYCDGDVCTNPVDGEKTCAVARWRNSGDRVHPAIETDSTGQLVNIDEVSADEIETLWGNSGGGSYEIDIAAEETDAVTEETVLSADEVADKEDGINLSVTTAVIIAVSAVFLAAIITLTVILAKKNKQ